MRSLLQQLENNESVLLMYVADELPGEDRAEVEQMLSTDAGMRLELHRLRSLHDSFTVSMAGLDGMDISASAHAAGVTRKVSRLMARQAALEAVRPATEDRPAEGRRFRIGGWAYPVAVAAAVLVAVGWWGRQPTSDYRGAHLTHHGGDSGRTSSPEMATLPVAPTDLLPVANITHAGELFELTADRDADRTMVAVAAGSVDVSAMFELDTDAKERR